jgi:ketosteroid isomerase-like protein
VSAQLEIVRNSLAGWSERDMDRMVESWAEDAVWDMRHYRPRWDGPEEFKGVDEFMLFLGEWMASWRSQELWAEELVERGDRVLAICNRHGVVRASGTEVERRWAMLWTFRDGLAVRIEAYSDCEEARAAFSAS